MQVNKKQRDALARAVRGAQRAGPPPWYQGINTADQRQVIISREDLRQLENLLRKSKEGETDA